MKFGIKLLAIVMALIATPLIAQGFSPGYNFLKAVSDRDGVEAEKLMKAANSSVVINSKDDNSGETALHIVSQKRYEKWTAFLLQNGANPNLSDKQGVTALMVAVRSNFTDGATSLVTYPSNFKINLDQANRKGETALIWAVQLNKPEMVRLLMRAGANADKADYSGQSARDYAKIARASNLTAIIESKGAGGSDADKKSDLSGFDFSGVGEKQPQ